MISLQGRSRTWRTSALILGTLIGLGGAKVGYGQEWQRDVILGTGIIGGYIRPSDPNRILFLLRSGILRSLDGGDSYEFVDELQDARLCEIIPVKNRPDSLFVLYHGDSPNAHLYFSPDGGTSFENRSTVHCSYIYSSPFHPELIVALGAELQVSRDTGYTFSQLSADIAQNAWGFAFSPSTDSLWYAIAHTGGTITRLFRSADYGMSWAVVDSVWENQLQISFEFQIDPLHPNVMFAVAQDLIGTPSHLLVMSEDGGVHWHERNLPGFLTGFASDSRMLLQIGEQLYSSLDAGETITPMFADGGAFPGASLDPYFSPDGILLDPTSSSRFFCGRCGLLFRTEDGGLTWSDLSDTNRSTYFQRVFPDPNDAARVVLAGHTSNLWRLNEAGDGWDLWSMARSTRLQFSNNDPGTLLRVSAHDGGMVAFSSGRPAIAKSSDDGVSWVNATGTLLTDHSELVLADAAMFPSNPNELVASLFERTGAFPCSTLFRSMNGGESWVPVDGIPTEYYGGIFLPDETNRRLYFLARSFPYHIYRCDESGGPFEWISDLNGGMLTLCYANGELFRLTPDQIQSSLDGGITFTDLPLPPGEIVGGQVHPQDAASLVIVTDSGLYRTGDRGDSWQEMNPPYEDLNGYTDLQIGPDGTVYFTDIANGSWVGRGFLDSAPEGERPPLSTSYRLDAIYPNPVNGSARIRYAVPHTGNVRIVVWDLLGRRVKTLVDHVQAPGEYTTTWNGRDEGMSMVTSGIYFVEMRANPFHATQKVVFLQ